MVVFLVGSYRVLLVDKYPSTKKHPSAFAKPVTPSWERRFQHLGRRDYV
jgi:hypothetical protein